MAVAYDLVLEERIIAREATRRRRRPFSQEVAEMVATRGRLSIARVRDARSGHSAGGVRSRFASRPRVARASCPRCGRIAAQGAADGARGRRHAAEQLEHGSRGPCRRAPCGAAAPSARTWPSARHGRPWTKGSTCSANAASSSSRAHASACATVWRCATTPAPSSTCCIGRRTTH